MLFDSLYFDWVSKYGVKGVATGVGYFNQEFQHKGIGVSA